MPLNKPYFRCYRPNITKNNSIEYLRDKRNVENPYDYIRKLEILYSRLEKIFEYVEPCENNKNTYSVQISSLMLDVCTTIEANFKAILEKNDYKMNSNLSIKNYFLVEKSHHLSSYKIKIPFWKPGKSIKRLHWEDEGSIRIPFKNWENNTYVPLDWYQAYNKVKHNMINNFDKATLNNLVDAFCGLVIIISAQFFDEEILIDNQATVFGNYGYTEEREYRDSIKTPFLLKFPTDWSEDEKYYFEWKDIKDEKASFEKYPY